MFIFVVYQMNMENLKDLIKIKHEKELCCEFSYYECEILEAVDDGWRYTIHYERYDEGIADKTSHFKHNIITFHEATLLMLDIQASIIMSISKIVHILLSGALCKSTYASIEADVRKSVETELKYPNGWR